MFYLQCDKNLQPTFSLGFVSIRYALAMQIITFNKRGHATGSAFSLRSPLQIAYISDCHGLANYEEYETDILASENNIENWALIKDKNVS